MNNQLESVNFHRFTVHVHSSVWKHVARDDLHVMTHCTCVLWGSEHIYGRVYPNAALEWEGKNITLPFKEIKFGSFSF